MKILLRNTLNAFLDLIYPRVCLSCRKTLQDTEKFICVGCFMELPLLEDNPELSERNTLKLAGRVPLVHTFCYLVYTKRNVTQKLIKSLKYGKNRELGQWLGRIAAERSLSSNNPLPAYDLLVSIPIHKKRRLERGYNQAEEIAKGISEYSGIPTLENCLERTVYTTSQTKKNRAERYKNIQNIYKIADGAAIKGKSIGLVDDVFTTGATIEVAAELLLAEGAKEVGIITIASTF